jgi:RNA polymerase sigma-70 factor, ECF subfamily
VDARLDLTIPMAQHRVMGLAPDRSAADQDAELVRAAQGGDRDAFGRLYVKFAPMVHGVLMARVPWSAVDDLVQDVFLSALERIGRLRTPEAFPGWLAAITRNRATDLHRRASTDPIEDSAVMPDQGPKADALRVLAAIQELPLAYRETLTLRLVEGMTGPEIAARTGLTAGSVRVNLHRGMKQLRDKLEAGRDRP